jgi:segregation and condensation protein A
VVVPHNQEVVEAPEKSSGFELSLSNFEGPFDLLLSLISKHELDITEVSLSRITDEFISYLKGLDEQDELDQASEFLVIAATLLDLKIAGLLPKGEVVDAEDVALLEARDLLFAKLLQYKAFKEISTWFATALGLEADRIPRDVMMEERFRDAKPELIWTLDITQDTMTPREIPSVGLTHLHASRVSIREQAVEVANLLRQSGPLTFREIIAQVKDRAVVIARFLSVLELYRLMAISFEQDSPLADLKLVWRAENFDDNQLANLGAEYDA